MISKLGRNDLCWCGSGLKYKRCHLDRDKAQPATIQEMIQSIRTAYGKEYCLHPQASPQVCSAQIVKAHTVQRGGGLTRIARNGHVYNFVTDFSTLIKNGGQIEPQLIGIKQASTFTGFCSLHDNALFEPIEKHPFLSSPEHTFLLGYRVLAKELFLKKAELENIKFKRTTDRGKDIATQVYLQDHLDSWEIGVQAAVRELEYHKALSDEALMKSDYSAVSYYVVRLNKTPDFLCSGALQPEYSFDGYLLQNLADVSSILDYLAFSVIATDTGGAVVFSWIGKSEASEKLVQSLDCLCDTDIPHAIARFAFEYFENIFVSPDWWDNLDENARRELLKRQVTGTQLQLERPPDRLADDGLRLVSWTVSARETNLVL